MAIYIDNAMFWARIRIRGGWKNVFYIAGAYAFIAVFFITLLYQLATYPRDKANVLYAADIMILAFQAVLLLFLCSGAIAGDIRRDIANRQIESNQLMPLAPAQAIVGYVAGGATQILALFVVNLLIGAVLALMRHVPVIDRFASGALLLLFSFSIWTAMALASFVSRGMFGFLFASFAGITFSGGFIFIVVPGLLAFTTPMHGRTMFQASSVSRLTTGTLVGMGAQILLALLCIRGAARKYADSAAQGVTLGPAMATLGIWAGLSWFGISNFLAMRPETLNRVSLDWRVMIVGAIASCLLVAMLPIAAIVWTGILRERRRRSAQHAPSRPWIFWLCLPAFVLFVISPLSATLNEAVALANDHYFSPVRDDLPVLAYGQHPSVAYIACACTIFLIQTYFVMRLLYPRIRRANVFVFLATALLWFGPLFGDLAYYSLRTPNHNPRMDHFALFSPLGTIIQSLNSPVRNTPVGLVAQAGIALIPVALLLLLQSRGRAVDAIAPMPQDKAALRA